MPQELSKSGQRWLKAQGRRRRYVADLELVRAAIEKTGAVATEPLLDFHRVFAGYMTALDLDENGPLGLIHPKVRCPAWHYFLKPMEVGHVDGSDPPQVLACADVHIQWEMCLWLDGRFDCNGTMASSFFLWAEQCGAVQDFLEDERGRWVRLDGDSEELNGKLVPRLGPPVAAVSDEYTQLYRGVDYIVTVNYEGNRHNAWVVEGATPEVLREFMLPKQQDSTDAEPGAAPDPAA